MKIALFMIMCSAAANTCMDPFKFSTHDTHFDCLKAGYEESINKIDEIGKQEINKHRIFIKFICTPDTEVKIETGV